MKYALFIGLIFVLLIRLITLSKPFSQGQKVRISAKISSDPIRYSYYQSINLKGLKISLPAFPEIAYGDYVKVEGVVNGKELTDARLIENKEARGFVYNFRARLLQNFRRALPEPHASLLAGVTLGIKSGLPADFWEALKKTGTAHIVVASGMNVSLVAGFLVNTLTIVLSRKSAIILAVGGIWFYALLSGFDAPIIRAAIMGTIAFGAQKVGRVNIASRGLIISALLMLIINPNWVSDVGFILSFLATASILAFQGKFEKLLYFLPQIIKENFSTALAAQIAVAPVIFVTFGQFNLLSPIINTLVAPTVAPMTIIAGTSSLVGLVIPTAGRILTLLAFPLTSYFIEVVRLFS